MNKNLIKIALCTLVLAITVLLLVSNDNTNKNTNENNENKTLDNSNVSNTISENVISTNVISENTTFIVSENTTDIETEDNDIPIIDGYYIYKNDNKTEIIGITEEAANKAMDLLFPSSVTKISNIHISSESLVKNIIFMNPDVIIEDVSFAGSNIETVDCIPTTLTEIPNDMFTGCKKLTTIGYTRDIITIPDHITTISNETFSNCTSITSVNLNKVITIGDYAFQGCSNLTNIKWGLVENIGSGAFSSSGVTRVNLPDSVKTIGTAVFSGCENLISLNINNVEKIGPDICKGCKVIKTFIANKNFIVDSEIESNANYDTLFDNEAIVEIHILANSNYAMFLLANPNSNLVLVVN